MTINWPGHQSGRTAYDSSQAHAEALFAGLDAGVSRERVESDPRFVPAWRAALSAIEGLPNEPSWDVVLAAARSAAARVWGG